MFDTCAHMLYTVADLVNQDFTEVAARIDDYKLTVETISVTIAKLESGAVVKLHGCGETISSCDSLIKVFCKEANLTADSWGRHLQIRRAGETEGKKIPLHSRPAFGISFKKFAKKKLSTPARPRLAYA